MSDVVDRPNAATRTDLSPAEIAILKAGSINLGGAVPRELCETDEGLAAIPLLVKKKLAHRDYYGTTVLPEGRAAVNGPSEWEVLIADNRKAHYDMAVTQDRIAAESAQRRIDRVARLGLVEVERQESFDRDAAAPLPHAPYRQGLIPNRVVSLFVHLKDQPSSVRASLDGSASGAFNLPKKFWVHPISRGDFVCAIVPRPIADWVKAKQHKNIEFNAYGPEIVPAGLDAEREALWRAIRQRVVNIAQVVDNPRDPDLKPRPAMHYMGRNLWA